MITCAGVFTQERSCFIGCVTSSASLCSFKASSWKWADVVTSSGDATFQTSYCACFHFISFLWQSIRSRGLFTCWNANVSMFWQCHSVCSLCGVSCLWCDHFCSFAIWVILFMWTFCCGLSVLPLGLFPANKQFKTVSAIHTYLSSVITGCSLKKLKRFILNFYRHLSVLVSVGNCGIW